MRCHRKYCATCKTNDIIVIVMQKGRYWYWTIHSLIVEPTWHFTSWSNNTIIKEGMVYSLLIRRSCSIAARKGSSGKDSNSLQCSKFKYTSLESSLRLGSLANKMISPQV
jgi:hypothetical protein